MPIAILGISAFYHDSAAALVVDGEVIAAVQEERFSRKRHDASFPRNAIAYCLREGNLSMSDIDYVVFYDKPFVKFERLLETYFAYAPRGVRSFVASIPVWIKEKLFLRDLLVREIRLLAPHGKKTKFPQVLFCEHHQSHAASAFFASPFSSAAVITVDGVGEWATASYGEGEGNSLELISEIHFPHSLGLLYSAFTHFTGFKVNSAEYKVMGLAPYGEPKYVTTILDNLIDLKDDGSFRLNMDYFNYCVGFIMTNEKFNTLFGEQPRGPETKLRQIDLDLARSIQEVTDEVMLRMARFVHKETGKENLCLAGGVALNCVANGRILRDGPFKNIWIQPASGDAGGALGATLDVWYRYLNNERVADGKDDFMKGSFLGPEFSDEEIEKFLKANNASYQRLERGALIQKTAELLAQEKIIGWFQGRMEFGPRALGSRSIIADARSKQMQSVMNKKIKYRESFRPFAPSVLEEDAAVYFELDRSSPYMLLVAPVKKERCIAVKRNPDASSLRETIHTSRSDIPAVTHVDYSARIQTVSRLDNELYYDLIVAFKQKTGCSVIVNTSFNVRGEPLVCAPQDAWRCFMRTQMDYLVIGSFLLDKKQQTAGAVDTAWQKEFELD